MSHGLAKTYGVSTDVGRQEKVGAAGCLGASLQDAPVDGTHLVGMVAEVGGRTGIIELNLASDYERTLVMRG